MSKRKWCSGGKAPSHKGYKHDLWAWHQGSVRNTSKLLPTRHFCKINVRDNWKFTSVKLFPAKLSTTHPQLSIFAHPKPSTNTWRSHKNDKCRYEKKIWHCLTCFNRFFPNFGQTPQIETEMVAWYKAQNHGQYAFCLQILFCLLYMI